MERDPLGLLTVPGGGAGLTRAGDALIAPDGRRFPIRDGIVRMLGAGVPAELAAELAAQRLARSCYLDERLLMTRHEPTVARRAAADLLEQGDGPVLDLGCGVGLCGRLWPGRGLVGLDASADLLAEARAGYALRVEGDAERLPFADGAFAAVLAINVLHHVPRPERAAAEIARVLRPGGAVAAVDPRRVGAVEAVKAALRRRDPVYAPTHRAFALGAYGRLFAAAGLTVERLDPAGLVTLLAAGGLDGLGLSRRLPGAGAAVAALERLDAALARVPGLHGAGLNLYLRARR